MIERIPDQSQDAFVRCSSRRRFIVGPTGTGKTTALLALVANRLNRGYGVEFQAGIVFPSWDAARRGYDKARGFGWRWTAVSRDTIQFSDRGVLRFFRSEDEAPPIRLTLIAFDDLQDIAEADYYRWVGRLRNLQGFRGIVAASVTKRNEWTDVLPEWVERELQASDATMVIARPPRINPAALASIARAESITA